MKKDWTILVDFRAISLFEDSFVDEYNKTSSKKLNAENLRNSNMLDNIPKKKVNDGKELMNKKNFLPITFIKAFSLEKSRMSFASFKKRNNVSSGKRLRKRKIQTISDAEKSSKTQKGRSFSSF